MTARIKIRKSVDTLLPEGEQDYPWYFDIEHVPTDPEADAMDYGRMATWAEALDAALDSLAHPERSDHAGCRCLDG